MLLSAGALKITNCKLPAQTFSRPWLEEHRQQENQWSNTSIEESRNQHRLLDGRDLCQGIPQPRWRRSLQGRNQHDVRLIGDNQVF